VKKALLIILIGLLIYGFALFNGFVWDDEVTFQKGGSILILANVYFRPAISAIISTIYNVFGPQPFVFHFFQLIFHITTAILVFYLFKRFFKETVSLILAIIFLVHPANVESVSFASAMQEVAFTLTGTIGLYLFVSSENLSISRILLSIGLLFTALLMKETAIIFFILVFCYLIFFKRKQADVLINYSIFAAFLLTIYLLVRISGGNLYVHGQGLFPIMRVSLITRLINIPSIIQYYLSMFFFPINLAIAQHWVIKSSNFINFFLPLILEILLFLSAVIYSIKKKDKIFVFFFLWFLVGLLPHLQIIPLNMTVAERWLYFPMIGLLGMMGSIMGNLKVKNEKLKIIFFSLAIIIISLLSFRSFIRTLDWRNGLTLFGHDIRKTSSFDLQNNFGTELFRAGRYYEAKKYFEISIKLAPYWWVNWNNLGVIYEREKDYKKAADYYQKSINNGQYYLAYENLAKILVLHGKDQKKTEDFLQMALRMFPENNNLRQIEAFYRQQLNQPNQ
jgi:protein O-mannosyl-transferase